MWRIGAVNVTHLGFLAGRSLLATSQLGGLRPTLGVMSLDEAEAMLNGGVVGIGRLQLILGARSVIDGLLSGELRYIERDTNEKWMSVNEIWMAGGGDCEDLSSAVVAELQLLGIKTAKVEIVAGGGRMAHAIVQVRPGFTIDPSVAGGMPSIKTTKANEVETLKRLVSI